MEIIDAHAHIYPEKIAAKATDTIGVFYDIKMQMPKGTPEQLLLSGSMAGISRYVVHSVATTAHQVRSINEFIKREVEAHPEFIGFITLHQDLSEEEVISEVEWACECGMKGIKLHPDFQKFNIDDEIAEKFYRAASGKLPILLHMGDDRYEYSKPKRLAAMAKKYPDTTFIAAHFGGYSEWDQVWKHLVGRDVWFDTSSTFWELPAEKAREIALAHGTEKLLFGSDYPASLPAQAIEDVLTMNLSEEDNEKIFYRNAEKLFGLEISEL